MRYGKTGSYRSGYMEGDGRLEYKPQDRSKIPRSGRVVLLLLLVAIITGVLFINSSFFSIGSVIVSGNKYVTTEDIYRIAEIPDKINIFRLHTSEIRNRLMNDLRIESVEVLRRFPSTIEITVKERHPVAYLANGYGFIEVDRQGIILAAHKSLKQVNVPMITGTRIENGYVGDKVDNPTIKNILQYLAALDEETLSLLSEINIKSPEQIVIYTVNSVQIRVGKCDRLEEKAKLTQDILKESKDKKLYIDYIDLTFASPVIKFKQ